nr:hypothetical protein Iba_chr02aCG9580 [Ipomoea batatas]
MAYLPLTAQRSDQASTGIHLPVQLEQLASDGEPRSTVAIVALRQRRGTLRWRRPNSSSAFIHSAFGDQGARWRLTEALFRSVSSSTEIFSTTKSKKEIILDRISSVLFDTPEIPEDTKSRKQAAFSFANTQVKALTMECPTDNRGCAPAAATLKFQAFPRQEHTGTDEAEGILPPSLEILLNKGSPLVAAAHDASLSRCSRRLSSPKLVGSPVVATAHDASLRRYSQRLSSSFRGRRVSRRHHHRSSSRATRCNHTSGSSLLEIVGNSRRVTQVDGVGYGGDKTTVSGVARLATECVTVVEVEAEWSFATKAFTTVVSCAMASFRARINRREEDIEVGTSFPMVGEVLESKEQKG